MQKKGVFDNLPWSCFIVQINMKTNRQQEITKTDFRRNKKKESCSETSQFLAGSVWSLQLDWLGDSPKLGNSMILWFEDNGVD